MDKLSNIIGENQKMELFSVMLFLFLSLNTDILVDHYGDVSILESPYKGEIKQCPAVGILSFYIPQRSIIA